jgi:regulator of RNase E activity RraA
MDHHELRRRFATLTTAHLADACLRAQVPVRCAPAALSTVMPGSRLAGRVAPAQHVGSVDIFLEALQGAAPGDVLVVDNGGRLDEACVGDLVALEAQAAGLEGLVIWGLHRDTADLRAIGLPVFSLGAIPTGPQRLDVRPHDALASVTVGEWAVGREDVVLGDDDGVLFVPAARCGPLQGCGDDPRHRATPSRTDPGRRLPAQAAAVRPLPCPAPTDAFPEFPRSSASRGRGHRGMTRHLRAEAWCGWLGRRPVLAP